MFFTSLFWDFLWWSWTHTRITFVVACMCIALQALLRHTIQYYSLWPSPALTAAIEISLLIQVRAGACWDQYTVTKIITEMHRINRKMICLKCFSFPFHLITISEGGNLAPVACPSRSGMLESCWRGPSVDLRVVFAVVAAAAHVTMSCAWGGVKLRQSEGSRGGSAVLGYTQVQKKRFASWSTVSVSSEKYSAGCVWRSPLWKGLPIPGGTCPAVWEHFI